MQEGEEKIRQLLNGLKQDQAQAGVSDLAKLGGALYSGFREGGIPHSLAATMTRDWFYLQIHRAMWGPSIAPAAPMWDIDRAGGLEGNDKGGAE